MSISVLWSGWAHADGTPAGEADDGSLRVDFDRRLRLDFHGSRITSDAGLLAYRELDDALQLTDLAGAALSECRRGKNTRHLLSGLLRQSVFGRLAGYEADVDNRRQAGPIWLPAGDVRPDAGLRAPISAVTPIVDQSAKRQPSSRRVTVAERPG